MIHYEYDREDYKEDRAEFRENARSGNLSLDSISTIREMRVDDIADDCSRILLDYLYEKCRENDHFSASSTENAFSSYLEAYEEICKIADDRYWQDWHQVRKEIERYVITAGVHRALSFSRGIHDDDIKAILFSNMAKMLDEHSHTVLTCWKAIYSEVFEFNSKMNLVNDCFIKWITRRPL